MHDTSLLCQNLHRDDHGRAQPVNKVMLSKPFGEAISEQGPAIQQKILNLLDHPVGMPQSDKSSLIQNLEIKQENVISPMPCNPEYPKTAVPQGVSGLTTGVQQTYGAYKGVIPQSQQEFVTQQHLISAQCLQENGTAVPAASDHNDHARNVAPQGVMGLTGEVQSQYNMCMGGFTMPLQETIVQHHITPTQCQVKQENAVSKTLMPNQSQTKQDSIVVDTPPSAGIHLQASERIVLESSKENPQKHPDVISSEDLANVRANDVVMQNVLISMPEAYVGNDPNKSLGNEIIKEKIFNNTPQQNAGKEILLQKAFNLHGTLIFLL